MKNRGFLAIFFIGLIIIIILTAGYYFFLKKPTKITNQPEDLNTPIKSSVSEDDVTRQVAYLIDAFVKDGKNYIEVDYGQLQNKETVIKTMINNGECDSPENCLYPSGLLIDNSNPKVRTLEVSPTVKINVDSDIRFKINEMYPPSSSDLTFGRNREITFNQLKEVLSKIEPQGPATASFKASKGIIFIDVRNNNVTIIEEPYRP